MNTFTPKRKHPNRGDIVEVRWGPATTKRAKFVRMTRTGSVVLMVERVDRGGVGTGEFGSARSFALEDLLRVLERFACDGDGVVTYTPEVP